MVPPAGQKGIVAAAFVTKSAPLETKIPGKAYEPAGVDRKNSNFSKAKNGKSHLPGVTFSERERLHPYATLFVP